MPGSGDQTVSVIIVNYNAGPLLASCVASALSQSTEIIIVDNASADMSTYAVASAWPHIKIIKNDSNLGFATACNIGAKAATCSNFLFLNPDCVLAADAVQKMLEAADSAENVGMVGGFLLLNWPPAKIFMGDVGSTWLAFMIFALALLSVQAGWLSYATWLVLAAVFVTDATVTLLTRLLRGERWYEAHRNHAYQKFARRWGGHRPVSLRAVAVNMLWLAPLAGACTAWPQWAFGWALLAYAPLVVGAVALGAGRQEHA